MKIMNRSEEKGVVMDSTGRTWRVRANYPWLNNPSMDKCVIVHPRPQFKDTKREAGNA
jgi:hypothetical protein